jgi:hypothetical protein
MEMPNITTCTDCDRLYEESSEEESNNPARLCKHCYLAKSLRKGDEVYWNDPDGSCSRVLEIVSITVQAGVAFIHAADGSEVECYVDELS